MTMKQAIAAAKAEARSARVGMAVIELLAPAPGEMRIWPCRAAWYDSLPDDHPLWARGPFLVGVASADGSFQTEW